MILNSILTIMIIYIFFSLFILPIQYRLLVAIKKEEAKHKLQGEMHDKMNAGELHVQENPLFFLANMLAMIMYRSSHKKTSSGD